MNFVYIMSSNYIPALISISTIFAAIVSTYVLLSMIPGKEEKERSGTKSKLIDYY